MFNPGSLKRKYCEGKTEVVTFRLPKKLKSKLEEYASQNGRTTTDIVTTALDQFVQAIELEDVQSKRKR